MLAVGAVCWFAVVSTTAALQNANCVLAHHTLGINPGACSLRRRVSNDAARHPRSRVAGGAGQLMATLAKVVLCCVHHNRAPDDGRGADDLPGDSKGSTRGGGGCGGARSGVHSTAGQGAQRSKHEQHRDHRQHEHASGRGKPATAATTREPTATTIA